MGYEAKKTEHCGPKRGNGAYWGYKWEAKKESNRIRRENAKREIRDEADRAQSGGWLADALNEVALRCANRSVISPLSDDEILGYAESGAPAVDASAPGPASLNGEVGVDGL
jgi:hypothetical protein